MYFCDQREVNPLLPSISQVLDFLSELFHSGLGYSGLCTARSALSSVITIDDKPLGQHHLIKRFMKGVFHLRPSLPRYSVTWDVEKVLCSLKDYGESKSISLKDLTLRCTVLFCLLSGQRIQSIHLIHVDNLEFRNHCLVVRLGDLLKQSRRNYHVGELVFSSFPEEENLCILGNIREYLDRTKPIRGSEKALFLGLQRPHKTVSKDTVSRWVKLALSRAGVDVTIFRPHSVRYAATSAASRYRVPLHTILRTAGWTQESTFRKHYNLPLTVDTSFCQSVLSKSQHAINTVNSV